MATTRAARRSGVGSAFVPVVELIQIAHGMPAYATDVLQKFVARNGQQNGGASVELMQGVRRAGRFGGGGFGGCRAGRGDGVNGTGRAGHADERVAAGDERLLELGFGGGAIAVETEFREMRLIAAFP